jgi:hypothetical protein
MADHNIQKFFPWPEAGQLCLLSALAVSVSIAVGDSARAQQPNQSLIQQKIQPMNQPQNLLDGQNQTRSQMQSQAQDVNQNQTQNQNAATNTFSPPVLHGLDQHNSASLTEPSASSARSSTNSSLPAAPPGYPLQGPSSSVASFFQIAPRAATDQHIPHGRAYNLLWHTLDNIGVPIPAKFGNHDPDIDPALTQPLVMPAQASSLNTTSPDATFSVGTPVQTKPTIIDPQAAALDPSQMTPDDTASKASTNSNPASNPQ